MKKKARKNVRNHPVSFREFPAAAPEQSDTEIAHVVKKLVDSAASEPSEFPKAAKQTEETELAHVK